MKLFSTLSKALIAFSFFGIFSIHTSNSYGQVITYTADTLGALSFTNANVTATSLTRVNGASLPTAICSSGFSTKSFTTAASAPAFSDTLHAVEVTVTPNSGHTLNVTSFVADLRRSNTGPTNARYAYSTNGGTTWTDQGTDQTPMHAGCDTLTTCTWTTSFTVAAPNTLKFRVYAYLSSSASGTFQIKNLNINGTVTPPTSISELNADVNNIVVFPNPINNSTKINYHLSTPNNVTINVFNLLGQQTAVILNNEMQEVGEYNISAPTLVPGIYFVRVTIGNETITKRIEKL